MSDVLKNTHVRTEAEEDLVVVTVGRARAILFYQTALEIARSVRMASKIAMQHEGVPNAEWRKLAATDQGDGRIPQTHPHFRRSRGTSNIRTWRVFWEGALVGVQLDNTVIKMHYSDAFQLHTWLRRAGKHAKAWAGDKSRTQSVVAHLTDAETNDKRNVA